MTRRSPAGGPGSAHTRQGDGGKAKGSAPVTDLSAHRAEREMHAIIRDLRAVLTDYEIGAPLDEIGWQLARLGHRAGVLVSRYGGGWAA